MRVATWNMNHWLRKPAERAAAWEFLSSLDLDAALLQETVPPDGAAAIYRSGGIDSRRPWGSAVVPLGSAVEELADVPSAYKANVSMDLMQTCPGSVAVGLLATAPPVVLVSAYGVSDGGYAITTLHRILSDITPLIDHKELGKYVVFGGDLNCSTQLPGKHRARHRNLFERFTTLGLVDLLGLTAASRDPAPDCPCDDDPCRHVLTHRHRGSRTPWHNDYLFATTALAKRLRDCQPLSDDRVWALSDHCPVVAEFDVP